MCGVGTFSGGQIFAHDDKLIIEETRFIGQVAGEAAMVTVRDDGGDGGGLSRRGATIRKEEQKLPSLAGNGLMAGIQVASSSGPVRSPNSPNAFSLSAGLCLAGC